MLLSLLTGLFLGVGFFFGGMTGAFIALVFAGIFNFASYWYSDSIVLKMYKAEELDKEQGRKVHAMVEELSEKADMPKPDVYVVDNNTPNAFATGRNPKNSALAVTSGLLDTLNDNELRGVISHEISHIKNRDTLIQTLSATVAGAVVFVARMMGYALLFGRNRSNRGLGTLFFIILAPISAMLIKMAISRSREYKADHTGAHLSESPLDLASALDKISKYSKQNPMKNASESTSHMFIINPLSSSGVSKLFSTHPATEERIKRLRELDEEIGE